MSLGQQWVMRAIDISSGCVRPEVHRMVHTYIVLAGWWSVDGENRRIRHECGVVKLSEESY